jgi:hypothetical protein
MPAIKIAPHWLTQAVLNLIVNAGESIPQGRRRAMVRLWATTADGGRMVRLGVTDNRTRHGARDSASRVRPVLHHQIAQHGHRARAALGAQGGDPRRR